MAQKIDGIEVGISADVSDFNRGMTTAESKLKSFGNQANSISKGMLTFGSAVGNLIANVLSKAFSSMASQMSEAISRFDTLNNYTKVMSNLGIGADEAQKSIEVLSEKLRGLPTTLNSGVMAVQRFTSANGSLKSSTGMFLALNNAILAGGASMEVQSSALEQISQAYAKGKPDMMEWRTMLSAMPAQLAQVAKFMGYASSNDLGEALRDGTVSMNQFMDAVMRLNQTGANGFLSFEEQARNATGGVATSIANLRVAIQRGLTDIMNAIGQANIAGFFSWISSAVATASAYIAGFIKVLLSAVNAISKLFGGKGISTSSSKVASAVGDAVNSVNDLDAGVGSVDEGLKDASGSAKKLKEQLAGFDEMNVLKEQDSGGGGGSGGAGGGGGLDLGDLPTFDWDELGFADATDKIEAIAKRIQDALASMFDFDTIGKALKRFVDDVKKGFEPIKKIIGDVWNDYIKPLISWSGNSLLPSVLNAIGGAINFIGEVLGKFWNKYLKPFIDDFVVPIARFIGSAIVDTLNGIGNGLRKMAGSEDVVERFADALAVVASVVASIKLSGLISSLTSAVGVFGKAYSAGLSLASSFGAVAGESSGLISALSGGLSTSITAVGSKLSGLWKILGNHPIALVVGAVVTLGMANENFRESVSSLIKTLTTLIGNVLKPIIELISNIAGRVGSLMNMLIDLVGSAIDPLIDLISGILDFLNPILTIVGEIIGFIAKMVSFGIETEINLICDALELLLGWLKPVLGLLGNITTAVGDFFSWIGDSIASLFGHGKAQIEEFNNSIIKLLDMVIEKEGDVAKAREFAIEKLLEFGEMNREEAEEFVDNELKKQGAMTESGEIVDELTRSFGDLREEIDKNRDGEISYSEAMEYTNNLLLDRASKELNAIHAEENQEKKLQALKQACEEYGITLEEANDIVDEGTNSHNLNEAQIRAVKEAVWESREADLKLESAQRALKEQTDKEKKSQEGLQKTYDEGIKILEQYSNGQLHTEEQFKKQQEECRKTKEAIQQVGGETSKLKDYSSVSYNAGVDIISGFKNGAYSGKGGFSNALSDIAQAGLNTFKGIFGIHSPSRVMYQMAEYVVEGAELGLESKQKEFADSMSQVARAGAVAFSDNIAPDTSGLKVRMEDVKTDIDASLSDVIEANATTHVVVNVGDEKLIDKVVDGINEASFLANRGVINI